MDHSDRVGSLETFDLNEKLGHFHDLNDTHDLNVTSQWPQQPHNDLTVTSTTSMEVMSSQKMWPHSDHTVTSTTKNDLNDQKWPQRTKMTPMNSMGDLNDLNDHNEE